MVRDYHGFPRAVAVYVLFDPLNATPPPGRHSSHNSHTHTHTPVSNRTCPSNIRFVFGGGGKTKAVACYTVAVVGGGHREVSSAIHGIPGSGIVTIAEHVCM